MRGSDAPFLGLNTRASIGRSLARLSWCLARLWRRARPGSFVLAALLASGCASLPELPPAAFETFWLAPAQATLPQIAAASLPADAPRQSGFQPFFAGESAFNARIALVRRAVRAIDLQVYEFAADETGLGLLSELAQAARRGVRVRLLVDDLHAGGQDALFAGLAALPNAQVRMFNPLPPRRGTVAQRLLGSLPQFGRVNRRMHNKLFLADGSFAIFGGRNVADTYFMNDLLANFLDLDVLAAGPVVAELGAVFDDFWNSPFAYPVQALATPAADPEAARQAFDRALQAGTVRLGERQRDWFGRPGILRQLAAGRVVLDVGTAQVWADAPAKAGAGTAPGPTVAVRAMALLASARKDALVMSPYFIPGPEGLSVLRQLSQQQVPVTLLTNSFGATDEPLVYAGYERYRLDLLRAGLRIHELSPTLARDSGRTAYFGDTIGRLHTKAMAIDGRWLFVGSLNLDPRSANINTELGVVIESPRLAQQLGSVFRRAMTTGSYALRLADGGGRVVWVATDWHGRETVLDVEPDVDTWRRLGMWLLQPFVPEALL